MAKRAVISILIISLLLLAVPSAIIFHIDPFFHYHAPLDGYYYSRNENIERYTNDGVARHFEFDSLITGISISAGFSISEFNSLFDTDAEKIIYSGGTYKETGEGISRALKTNPDMKVVLCSLFLDKLYQEKDHRRPDIADIPTYLYNDLIFDDIKYLFNKDVLFNYCYPMITGRYKDGAAGGVESLDTEGYIGRDEEISYFDPDKVFADREPVNEEICQEPLSEEDAANVRANISQNVIQAARQYPNTRFIYFVPPCSILHYSDLYESGKLLKTLQAEEIAIDMLLDCDNIEVYSFNDRKDIIEDLKNYSDPIHYGGWIYSFILESIDKGEGRLTRDNAGEFLENEKEYLMGYDY
ncbi:hypothetical protein [Butyrivibrio sp. MC2013]|uniref:hypothetical protein n=1 Tax=Butyrivibrio sp. MC2013 TaxID=1280686 RepID=UPI0004079885|nr:hypothetical protein [Butyrivibrio sp. MC2013]